MATASCGWPITGQAPGRDCTITPTCPDRACTSPTRKLWDEVEATYRWWVDAGSPDATHSRFAVTPRWATGGIGIGWFTLTLVVTSWGSWLARRGVPVLDLVFCMITLRLALAPRCIKWVWSGVAG